MIIVVVFLLKIGILQAQLNVWTIIILLGNLEIFYVTPVILEDENK